MPPVEPQRVIYVHAVVPDARFLQPVDLTHFLCTACEWSGSLEDGIRHAVANQFDA